ncbi:MAG TPA: hypothetical protein PKD86_02970 [Gemmatales bacterium]|nr:hypothetical protein [Gemmatales bacterium]HMP58294.1 hypothetical protein [Gemmatales bacterium]
MSLQNVNKLQPASFQIPRYTDTVIVEKLDKLTKEGGYQVGMGSYEFIFADQKAEFVNHVRDANLDEILNLGTVSTRSITLRLNNSLHLRIERAWDHSNRKLIGNLDTVTVTPSSQGGQSNPSVLEIAKLIALARKHFEAADTKPFMDFLDEGSKQLYQSREQDLQKLERMQESFFKNMTEFTLDQQRKQQEFQRQVEAEYASRQSRLEEQHQDRLKQFEAKEAELKKYRSEIDERENRQARRDIYKELKAKLDARNKSFELTEGTKNRRRFTFWFTVALLVLFAGVFAFCFSKNVVSDPAQINWVAVGSQIGFAIAFIGVATFFIRWNNQWFQKHADEEFKLKRLDLDIDRANWLVELAMEWKNITKSDIPDDLMDKLAHRLFTSEDSKELDMHPAETFLSALFGKAGRINLEFPNRLEIQRSDVAAKENKTRKP